MLITSGYQEKFYFNPGDTGFKVGAVCFFLLLMIFHQLVETNPVVFVSRFSKRSLQKLELVRACLIFVFYAPFMAQAYYFTELSITSCGPVVLIFNYLRCLYLISKGCPSFHPLMIKTNILMYENVNLLLHSASYLLGSVVS